MSVSKLCKLFGVGESGYYSWKSRSPCRRSRDLDVLTVHVRAAYEASNRTYGSPRITAELQAQGLAVGRHRVMQIMRANGLKVRPKKRFVRTTNSSHSYPVSPNRLGQNFKTFGPDEKWVADISYIWTSEGWLYLAVVLDLFSRRIVGWAVRDTLKTDLALEALQRALALRQPPHGLIHHSDRGIQYCSKRYQDLLKAHGILSSMSAKGNCYDNAPAESFFKTLKSDLVWRTVFASRQSAKRELEKYINAFYNSKRRHSALNFQSSIDYEKIALTTK